MDPLQKKKEDALLLWRIFNILQKHGYISLNFQRFEGIQEFQNGKLLNSWGLGIVLMAPSHLKPYVFVVRIKNKYILYHHFMLPTQLKYMRVIEYKKQT